MKIGIRNSSYYINNSNNTDYICMKNHGYDCADFQNLKDIQGVLHTCSYERFEKILLEEKNKALEADIKFFQVHAPWPVNDSTDQMRRHNLECMKRAVEGTSVLNAKYLVVHPIMPDWENEDNPDFVEEINYNFFAKLCDFSKGYNIGICIENMAMKNLRLSRIPRIVKFVKNIKRDNMYICLDTGHANVCGDSPGEMVHLCGNKLKTLHVHDNNSYKDEHLYPYFGTINWSEFKNALFEEQFEGILSIEADIDRNFPSEMKEYMAVALAKFAKSLAE